MKDQMERIVEEQAAMQAEIARLRRLLEAERNGNQTLQAEVTRSAYMVAEAPDLSWLKSFAEADREEDDRDGVSALKAGEIPDRDANGHFPGCYGGSGCEATRCNSSLPKLQHGRDAAMADMHPVSRYRVTVVVNDGSCTVRKQFVDAPDGMSAVRMACAAVSEETGCMVSARDPLEVVCLDRDENDTPPNGIERRCGTCARWDPHGVQPTSLGTCGAAEAPTYWNELCLAWLAKA